LARFPTTFGTEQDIDNWQTALQTTISLAYDDVA